MMLEDQELQLTAEELSEIPGLIKLSEDQDLTLWKSYHTSPTGTNLRPLLDKYDTMIQKRVNQFNTAEVPKPALQITAKRLAVEAFKTYDPKREASLGTHVYQHLKRLSRYVGTNQNIGKIPENRRLKITQFKIARDELTELLGREPSLQEIAERLIWPLQEAERMESELRGTVTHSVFAGDMPFNSDQPSRETTIIKNIYYELTPEEQTIYEYLLGIGGKPKLNESQIATKLKISITKVSRIKHEIGRKIQQYI